MSITLELTPDEEQQLRREADARGVDVTSYVRTRVFTEPFPTSVANDAAFLLEEGCRAVSLGQQELHARGVGYVFGRDGEIIQLNPDGSETIIADSGATDARD